MSGCRSKPKPVVCLVCVLLWLPFQQEGCGGGPVFVISTLLKNLVLNICCIFSLFLYTVHYRCNKEASVIGTIKSFEITSDEFHLQWHFNKNHSPHHFHGGVHTTHTNESNVFYNSTSGLPYKLVMSVAHSWRSPAITFSPRPSWRTKECLWWTGRSVQCEQRTSSR